MIVFIDFNKMDEAMKKFFAQEFKPTIILHSTGTGMSCMCLNDIPVDENSFDDNVLPSFDSDDELPVLTQYRE